MDAGHAHFGRVDGMATGSVADPCRAALLSVLIFASASDVALACRARPADKAVLLEAVPDEARGSPVVARVVLVAVYERNRNPVGWSMAAEAGVLEAIRGVEVGRVVRIAASPRVCSSALQGRDVGRDGFVAGEFRGEGDQVLVGFWELRHAQAGTRP